MPGYGLVEKPAAARVLTVPNENVSIDERLLWPPLSCRIVPFLCIKTERAEETLLRYIFQLCFICIFFLLQRMKAGKCPSDELSLTNCAVVNPQDFTDSVK